MHHHYVQCQQINNHPRFFILKIILTKVLIILTLKFNTNSKPKELKKIKNTCDYALRLHYLILMLAFLPLLKFAGFSVAVGFGSFKENKGRQMGKFRKLLGK